MFDIILYILLAALVLLMLAMFLGATNIRFNGKPRPGQIKIACVGDSTTYGTAMPNEAHNCYPAQLQRLLGDAYHVANFGVHGKTVQDTTEDSYRLTKQYRQSLQYSGDIIVIMMGANDTKLHNWTGPETFAASYREFVGIYTASGKRVILCTPASIYHMPDHEEAYSYGVEEAPLLQECDIIRSFAAEQKLELIDVQAITSGHPEWYVLDKVHPNKHGAEAIARAVFEKIAEK